MATQRKTRRGTNATLMAMTPAEAEVGYDSDNKRVIVGDGSTPGGIWLPNWMDIQGRAFNSGAAGGTADAITVSTAKNPDALAARMRVYVQIASNNTGAATLQWGSTTATAIQKWQDGAKADMEADDLVAGQIVPFDYDGTDWVAALGGTGESVFENTIASIAGADTYELITDIDTNGYNEIDIFCRSINNSSDTSDLVLEMADAEGYENSGYNGYYGTQAGASGGGGAANSNIMLCPSWPNADAGAFIARFRRIDASNTWVYETIMSRDTTGTQDQIIQCAGYKATSAATTAIRIRRITSAGQLNGGEVTVRAR